MFERAEPFARARWETDRPEPPQPSEDRCSTILPVAPNGDRECRGLDPPEAWLDDFELEPELGGWFEPSPMGPDTILTPPDPQSAPTLRP